MKRLMQPMMREMSRLQQPRIQWTPAEITTAAWYDASDAGTITEAGGSVSQWDDKSGNGHNVARGTGAAQPTTGVRTIGGLNAIDYDGSDSLVASGADLDTTNLSVILVRQWDDVSGTLDKSFHLIHNGTFDSVNEEAHGGASLEVGIDNPDNEGVGVGTSLAAGILSYVKSGGNSQKAWLDGNSQGQNTNAVTNFSTNLIYAGSGLDGAIGELIYIESSILDDDRQKIEGYLAHKWFGAGNDNPLPYSHPYKYSAPVVGETAPALFTPSDISAQAWYDAEDEDTITEAAGSVSQWDDKSGNARHLTQGTGGAQPETGVRTLNGLNVLDFDGSDRMSKSAFPIVGFNVSIFMVAEIDTINNASDSIFSLDASKDFQFEANNATQFDGQIDCTGASNPDVPLTGGPFPGPSIYNALMRVSGLRIEAFVDGVLRGSNSLIGGISGSQTLRIFADSGNTQFVDGAVAEVVIVSTATTDVRQKLEGYLAWKWELTANLPSDHPYKSTPPPA